MTDTIHGDVRPFLRTIDAATPEQVVKTAQAAAAHIDAQDAKIKALEGYLASALSLIAISSDHGMTIEAALAAAKETSR